VNLYYELHGTGPIKILLINGFMTSCASWTPQIRFFKQYAEFEVCILDNRGYGLSSVPSSHYATSDMAMDAIELVDHLKWDLFHLIGLSMGGMIALEMSLRATNRLQSLALCVTHCGGISSLTPFMGVIAIARVAFSFRPEQIADTIHGALYSKEFLEKSESGITMYDKLREDYVRITSTIPKPSAWGFFGQIKAALTHFVSNQRLYFLKDSGIPILIMTGTYDFLVRPENSHFLHKFLAAEMEIFEGAGHCINIECEEKFNEALLKHIRKAMNPNQKPQIEEVDIDGD